VRYYRDWGRYHRLALLWSAAFYLGLQLALTLLTETCLPEVYDREYRDRLMVLRQRVREAPGRPLLLVVGSSRITTDFRPEALPPLEAPGGERPLPFNLSHSGSGPLMNLVLLQRAIREGFVPRWAVIEVVPSMLSISGRSSAAKLAQAGDLPTLRRYVGPWKLYGHYLFERLGANFSHRDAYVRECAPGLLCQDATWDSIPLDALGGSGAGLSAAPGPEEVRRRTAVVHAQYYAGLQRLSVADMPDRAMRELLELCRERHIEAAVLLAPESSEFRGWYSPEARAALDGYCGRLNREYGVPVVDARGWLADESFLDGHHALAEGARQFTLRLGREVLQPLVEGRPLLVRRVAER
jgi:hypothetical protein